MEAVDRLQTQLNYNRAILERHDRLMEDMGTKVNRLSHEMGRMAELFEGMRREMMIRPAVPSAHKEGRVDDHALEVMGETLASVAAKTNEVDGLKIQIEMMKRKIKRLEDATPSPSLSNPPITTPRDGPMDITPIAHPPPPLHTNTPIRQDSRPPVAYPPHASYTVEMSPPVVPSQATPQQQHEIIQQQQQQLQMQNQHHAIQQPRQLSAQTMPTQSLPPQSQLNGWTSVNSAGKRHHPFGVEDIAGVEGTPAASPKRQKLAALELRKSSDDASPQPLQQRPAVEPSPAPPRLPSREHPYPDSMASTNFIPYQSTGDANPDDSWRPESQRPHHPNGHQATRSPRRGRGGGRGRGRKSLPIDIRIGTPEWEKPEWTGSQIGPDGYYHPITPSAARGGKNVIRRGSGGARVQTTSPPAMLVHEQIVPGLDPYAHTKKSRTKPIRNADGVLIRKDGRPDMRSQSSAANLRKVHARKEEEKGRDGPTSGLATSSVMTSDSPDSHMSDAAEDRHNQIMTRMFPNGIGPKGRPDFAAEFNRSGRVSPSERTPSEMKEMKREARSEEEMVDGERDVHDERDEQMVNGDDTPAEPQEQPLSTQAAPVGIDTQETVIEETQATTQSLQAEAY